MEEEKQRQRLVQAQKLKEEEVRRLRELSKFKDSSILGSEGRARMNGYFKSVGKQHFSTTLLYKGTRDGFESEKFH